MLTSGETVTEVVLTCLMQPNLHNHNKGGVPCYIYTACIVISLSSSQFIMWELELLIECDKEPETFK